MARVSKRLEDYPRLVTWYEKAQSACSDEPSAAFVAAICHALGQSESDRALVHWMAGLSEFFDRAIEPLSEFLNVEALLANLGLTFNDIACEFGELAIESSLGKRYGRLMERAADLTGLVSFRFFSAWTALNDHDLARCITECEKVAQPYAAVHTLQGQALLESGQVQEAIEALSVATALSPQELLAWFQLAKAHHVLGHKDNAWTALNTCHALAPQSAEIALFMSIVALSGSPDPAQAAKAWAALLPHLDALGANEEVIVSLVELGFVQAQKELMSTLAERVPWAALRHNQQFLKSLGGILRRLGQLGWHDVASTMLTRLTDREGTLAY